jgi:Fic family protein
MTTILDYNSLNYAAYQPKGYPVKHKRKVPFKPNVGLNPKYREIIKEIRECDGTLEGFILSADTYSELLNEVYSSNVHWSVKLEGNNLPLDEVKRLTTLFTKGDIKDEKRSGPAQEILNHLYSFFVRDLFRLPWNIETVLKAHSMLMEGTGTSESPGAFRERDAAVSDANGFEFFIACPPKHIKDEIRSLVGWLETSPYDELITSVLFFHEFESIHPFDDGNGRTGRTLFQILLQELGLKNCKLCRFEQEMLRSSEIYYNLLAYTDDSGDYEPLIMYTAESLLRAYKDAVVSFREKDHLKEMDENSRTIVKNAKSVKSFSVQDAAKWVPGLGEQTIRNRANELVTMGILEKEGKTKAMRYSFKDPFKEMKVRTKKAASTQTTFQNAAK